MEMTAPVEILPEPSKNLFACETKEEIHQEMQRRREFEYKCCICGKPAKYYTYCWCHAPEHMKKLYFQRHILEKQALNDYKSVNNDTQNPSIVPDELKAKYSNGRDFMTFAKIKNGQEIGIIFYPITPNEAIQ